ncbi:MAG: hypothetical protein EZS28_022410 [Streblomastix strix]|uniref:Uncharacterized protein n=1 Tax=Streblomastix strix TaxID=222440 RepID=A0A5J4VHS6_9EUKA|nr:MAG: hypothetical protein EZS28_022410 [Streblomastix strix]
MNCYNIFLSSFVTDGCIAQVSGLDLSNEKSFANIFDPKCMLPFHVPSSCHIVQNLLKHASLQSKFFQDNINILHELASLIRNRDIVQQIGARCPALVDTRWLIYSKISNWILDRRNKVLQNVDKSFHPFKQTLHFICYILEPLSALIKFFESDYGKASEVIIMVYQALQYYNNLVKNFSEFQTGPWRNAIEIIANCLEDLFFEGNSGCLFSIMYSLTPPGAPSMLKHNLLSCFDLPPSPEREQIPVPLDYMQNPEDILQKQFKLIEIVTDNEEILDEEEIQKQDKSENFKPLNDDVSFQLGKIKQHNLRKLDKTKNDIQLDQMLFSINPQKDIHLEALQDIDTVDFYTTCIDEIKEQVELIYRVITHPSKSEINQCNNNSRMQKDNEIDANESAMNLEEESVKDKQTKKENGKKEGISEEITEKIIDFRAQIVIQYQIRNICHEEQQSISKSVGQ